MADIINNEGLDATELNVSRMGLEAIAEQDPAEETALVQYVEPNVEQPVNTGVIIPGCAVLPSVQNQSEEALEEPTKMAETMLSNAKWALKHTNSPDDFKNYYETCKTTIYLNSWLLYREVQKVENVKADVKAGKYPSYNKAWEFYKLSRKKWENRKNITFKMVEEATNKSLAKLETKNWDLEDLPTMYQLNQSLQPVDETENDTFSVLKPGEEPQLELPENTKFQVIYGDLSYKIGTEELRNYIAEDAVGFFWINGTQVQESLDVLKQLRFTIKDFAFVDTGKSHTGGTFTTRQHKTMVIAVKGTAPKPEDFKLDSVVFDREIGKTEKHPLYYAETIQQMYPAFPALEIHSENFKYLNQNYLITEIKGDSDGTK